MLKEIKFPQEVSAVKFMNNRGDLLVAHNTNLSTIPLEDLALDNLSNKYLYPLSREELASFY